MGKIFTAKIIAAVLCLMLFAGMLPAYAEEAQYPDAWSLDDLFVDAAAWEDAFADVMEEIAKLENLRGTLDTSEGYLQYFQMMDALTPSIGALVGYSYLRYSLDASDPEAITMMAKTSLLYVQLQQSLAFFDEEVASLSLERRAELFADESLQPYAYALSPYLDEDFQYFSEETTTALSYFTPALSEIENIRNTMADIELPKVKATLTDGTEVEIGDQEYAQFIHSDASREDKSIYNQAFVQRYVPYQNTFAAILNANALQAYGSAQLDKKDSVREMQMDAGDIDPVIYDLLIEAAHEGTADFQRYYRLLKEVLGLDVMYPFDTAEYASDFEPEGLDYDTMVREVRDALSVLGDQYLVYYDAMVSSGHIDVYPTDTKTSGAYSLNTDGAGIPYLLLNVYGVPGEAATLAHETGHALYSMQTEEAQDSVYYGIPIFMHEVASTTNEIIYYLYKMDNAKDESERLYYIEECIQMFLGTFFMQALYSEFEDVMYSTVENGGALNAEMLNEAWSSLYDTYRGDTIMRFEGSETQWAGIPHFLGTSYYVYQYATSVTYASAIAQRIMNGEEGAVEDYLTMLHAGASAPPAELLSIAGIDPLEKSTYDSALNFFKSLVDEYESLTLDMRE